MRKLIPLFLSILLIVSLTVPALAASEAPEITLQPQSPNYPAFSVAIYTVKASGNNLTATWYMEWQGTTYTASDIGGAMQAWEPYAGAAYGARKLDDNTFSFTFEGIGAELDGAYIWCVIEDGHYDVVSEKVRINVSSEKTPPTILDVPAQLTVEQGGEAEIRCIAQAPGEMQLSFLWYETDTGRMEDMRAVNRGTETSDFLFCDTSQIGTRYYICMVETSEGGVAYSSVIPVTVTEKAAPPTQPAPTQPAPTQPAPAQPVQTQPAPTQPQAPSVAVTVPVTEPPTTVPETKQETTAPTQAGKPAPTKAPTQQTEATAPTQPENVPAQDAGLPWWSLVLIGLVGAGAGVGAAIILIRKNQNTK